MMRFPTAKKHKDNETFPFAIPFNFLELYNVWTEPR